MPLPDPAVVVLIGAAGSGKSTWAAARYRRAEIVSSDDLRGIVGSGPADLDASTDAFDLLERIVAARLGRGLTTVIDTLGLDADRRRAWLTAARAAGLPAVAVVLDTPGDECRRRNAAARPPRPGAPPSTDQVRRVAAASATTSPPRAGTPSRSSPPDVHHPRRLDPNRDDRGRPRSGTTRHPAARTPRGAAAVAVPLGRGPGRLGARRSRSRPTRPASPGSR